MFLIGNWKKEMAVETVTAPGRKYRQASVSWGRGSTADVEGRVRKGSTLGSGARP